MPHVLVTADFPGVTSSQRDTIYKCLEKKEWVKIPELGRDVSTVWRASFRTMVSDERAKQIAIEEFQACSKSYCKVKLVVHSGASLPTDYGLT